MRILKGIVSFAAAIALAAPALAATLGSVKGSVMVNRGGGYQAVYGPTQLKVGDIVVVNPGGSAQLTYPDGCSVQVQMGAVVTIGEQSPCATQASNPGFTLGGPGIILLNVGIAAGVVGVLVANQNSDKPASP